MKPLRDYQARMVSEARVSLAAGHKRIVMQAPTGSGKTRVIAEMVKLAQAKRKRVLVMAPRRELVDQILKALAREGVFAGTIMSGERAAPSLDIQVSSVDTLHARGMRSKRMPMPDADMVIFDECHLSLAKTRKDIIAHYDGKAVIGFTATPARGDGKGLGEIYQDLVLGPSVAELTEAGFLVPARYFAPTAPDLAAVGLDKDGDYRESGLGVVMDDAKLIGDIVQNWLRIARDRRTVVFCVNCAHSRHVTEEFLKHGIAAEHLDGETPKGEREDILERVERGATQVLCNVFVASYGLDITALDCAVLARPTKNIALYLQTVGRVLRPHPGKVDALVIDHAGAVLENGFADDFVPWSLDPTEKVKDRKAKAAQDAKTPKELECAHCHTVFRGRRSCPSCGNEVIPAKQEIPTYQADLGEIDRPPTKGNRSETWEAKCDFIGQLRMHAYERGYASGWVANQYRKAYGVWPNDKRVKMAPSKPVTPEVASWLKSQQIRYAKGKGKAA